MFDLLEGDNLQGRKEHIANEGYKFLDLADISELSLPPCGRQTGDFSAALRAAPNGFSSKARELRAPGLRAYFCHAAKVGKNALEPTVQDSLIFCGG